MLQTTKATTPPFSKWLDFLKGKDASSFSQDYSMATAILPNSRFLHIPKTGGSWVCTVLEKSGIGELAFTKLPHPIRRTSPGQGLFTFAFVRHPLTWFQSYWKYKFKTGHWNPYRSLDAECRANTFHQFLDNVIEKCPGFYSEYLLHFVGPPNNPIDFIGKQENLVEDLLTALDLAKEQYNPEFPEFVRSSKHVNVAPQALLESENQKACPQNLRPIFTGDSRDQA
jgi:hypothetical protein